MTLFLDFFILVLSFLRWPFVDFPFTFAFCMSVFLHLDFNACLLFVFPMAPSSLVSVSLFVSTTTSMNTIPIDSLAGEEPQCVA